VLTNDREIKLMAAVDTFAKFSNCMARKLACLAIDDHYDIIGIGWNGTMSGFTPCEQGGCGRCADSEAVGGSIPAGERLEECICLHAEQHLAALHGRRRLLDSRVLITTQPCTSCAKLLLGCGVREVIYRDPYPAAKLVRAGTGYNTFSMRQFHV
jgi:dCMP deaminase